VRLDGHPLEECVPIKRDGSLSLELF
jgi:hypothetical protein